MWWIILSLYVLCVCVYFLLLLGIFFTYEKFVACDSGQLMWVFYFVNSISIFYFVVHYFFSMLGGGGVYVCVLFCFILLLRKHHQIIEQLVWFKVCFESFYMVWFWSLFATFSSCCVLNSVFFLFHVISFNAFMLVCYPNTVQLPLFGIPCLSVTEWTLYN